MATFNQSGNNQNNPNRPSISRRGRSVAERAFIRVSQICLREYKKPNDFWEATGTVLQGPDAYLKIAEYNKANFDRRFEQFRKDLNDLAMQVSFEEEMRALNGKSITDRANEYMVGKIMSAFNTAPQSFTVGEVQYRTETISYTRYLDPIEAVGVINGTHCLGSGQTASMHDEPVSNMVQVIDRETLERCVELFRNILKPEITGNRLFYNGKLVATFSDTASTLDNVKLGDRQYSISDVKVI